VRFEGKESFLSQSDYLKYHSLAPCLARSDVLKWKVRFTQFETRETRLVYFRKFSSTFVNDGTLIRALHTQPGLVVVQEETPNLRTGDSHALWSKPKVSGVATPLAGDQQDRGGTHHGQLADEAPVGDAGHSGNSSMLG